MVTFSGFTYLVACFFLIIIGYVLTPDHAFGGNDSTKMSTFITMILSVIGLAVYLWASIYYKRIWLLKEWISGCRILNWRLSRFLSAVLIS